MKDFAKSIRTNNSIVGNISADITTDGNTWFVTTSDGKKKEFTSEREAEEYVKKIKTGNSDVENEYNPGSYDPNDHKRTLWRIDNEISKWRREISYLKQRIAGLEAMVSSGQYGSLTNKELKEAKRDQETAYMRLEQALSMKKRATGNEKPFPGTKQELEEVMAAVKKQWDDYVRWGRPESDIKSMEEAYKRCEKFLKEGNYEKTGNSKVGNEYNWEQRRGHLELYNPNVPFGGHTMGIVEKSKNGYIGAKTNGSIVISKKEFATEEEAKKYVENKKVGNAKYDIGQRVEFKGQDGKKETGIIKELPSSESKGRYVIISDSGNYYETFEETITRKVGNSNVGNANKTFSGKYLDIYDNGIVVAKEGWAFGERFNENTFGRWIDEQIRMKEKVLQECKQMKREFESNY